MKYLQWVSVSSRNLFILYSSKPHKRTTTSEFSLPDNRIIYVFSDFITEFDLTDGDNLMKEMCAGSSCRACKVPLPHGHDVCRLCINHHHCADCSRWLPPALFPDSMIICEACLKRKMKEYRKSAFDGIVCEEPINTSVLDVDIGEFIRTHAHVITDIIQQAVNRHT